MSQVLLPTVFKKDLEKDVAGDTSGNFAKLLLALVQVRPAQRPSSRLMRQQTVRADRSLCLFSLQTKRAEPSSIVDYEKIDEDARVSYPFSLYVCD